MKANVVASSLSPETTENRPGSSARRLLFGLTITIFALAGSRLANANELTNLQENIEALNESAITANSMLGVAFGSSPNELLTMSGVFSDTGFSYSMVGTYANMAVTLAFTGAFDSVLQTESFSATGTVGASSWSESGVFSFNNSNPNVTVMNGAGSAALGPSEEVDYENVVKNNTVVDNGSTYTIRDAGSYDKTKGGKKVGPTVTQISSIVVDKPKQKGDEDAITNDTFFTGTLDLNAGSFSAQITAAPEPGSILLLCSGIAGVFLRLRTK